MITDFTYNSSKGSSLRKVLVIKDTDKFIEGLDLSILSKETVNHIVELYKDYKPTSESVMIDGWDPAWNIAWRKFSKSKISH